MNHPQPISDPNMPVQAETACGARIRVTSNTPSTHSRDQIFYFCSLNCKLLYEEDPLSSCMAAHLLSDE